MYCEFFGLSALPFNNTPDPRFFFNTPDHEEALASLIYAAEQRKGFVLVTGEVGAGKTLLSRILLGRLRQGAKTAAITNSRLTGGKLLAAICREFKIQLNPDATPAAMSHALEEFLLEQYARDQLAVLILDEAQNLPIETFEELRMLGNLEADDAKLLQVLILGQPELQETFRQPSMRQIQQRIFRTFHLRALDHETTAGYVLHRIKIAGAGDAHTLFDREALDAIYYHSEGIPRLINQICDNAMLAAYTDSRQAVSAALIHEVVEQMMALTVTAGDPKPHGAFARQQLGLSAGLQIPEADRPTREMPARPKSIPTAADELLDRRIVEIDSLMHRMMDRLAKTEGAMQTIRNERAAERAPTGSDADSPPATTATTASAELETIRQIREQAADLLQSVIKSSEAAYHHMHGLIKESRSACEEVKQQARFAFDETDKRQLALRDRIAHLLQRMTRENVEQKVRLAELLRAEQSRFEGLEKQTAAVRDQLEKESSARNQRIDQALAQIAEQSGIIQTRLDGLQGHGAARIEEIGRGVDEFMDQIGRRMNDAHQNLAAMTAAATKELDASRQGLAETRDTILSDAQAGQSSAQQLFDQTRDLLSRTREHCASMLAGLRAQVGEQREKAEHVWHSAAAEGAKTLNEFQSRLAEARLMTDRSRDELEALVDRTAAELTGARKEFDASLDRHKTEIAKLSTDAKSIKSDIAHQFDEARQELTRLIEDQRKGLQQRIMKLVGETGECLTSSQEKAKHTIESLRAELAGVSKNAERIYANLQRGVDVLEKKAGDCRAQCDHEAARLHKATADIIDRNRRVLDEAQARVDALSQRAAGTTAELESRIVEIKDSAQTHVAGVAEKLESCLADALAGADQIHQQSESTANTVAERLVSSQRQADAALTAAEKAVAIVREQSRSSLAEVRSGLTQMTERADSLRGDLTRVGEDLRATSQDALNQIRQAGDAVTEHIESLRQSAQSDAEAHARRLAVLRDQVESGGENVRRSAAKMLEQVQDSAETLRKHADDLLAQAASGSDKLGDQAGKLMEHAQAAADRFRDQAETLLKRAETTANSVRGEVDSLRTIVRNDAEQVREQIASARADVGHTKEQSAAVIARVVEVENAARRRSDEVLRRADEVQTQTKSLLEMPNELVQEATRQASALNDMSRKISSVVKQLSSAGNQAVANHEQLHQANTQADQKLHLLREHTAKLGELVGTIRQLYGGMDARLQRLRDRLSHADNLARSVPQEIDRLRDALAAEVADSVSASEAAASSAPSRPIEIKQSPVHAPAQFAPAPRSASTKPAVAKPTRNLPAEKRASHHSAQRLIAQQQSAQQQSGHQQPAHQPPAAKKGSLGEVVTRNQKLNEWLKQMLGEADQPAPAENKPIPDRTEPARQGILKKVS